MPQERPSRVNLAYLSSCYGILKICELICCSLAFSLCAAFRNSSDSRGLSEYPRDRYFVIVEVAAWLFALLMIFLNVTGRIAKNNVHCKPIWLAITHGFIAVMLLIPSLMCTKILYEWYNTPSLCDLIDEFTDATCETYAAAVGCGFVSLVLFAIDAVFHIIAETKCYLALVEATTHTEEDV